MRMKYLFVFFLLAASCMTMTSCCRSRNEVWDDTKSCGRHITRGLGSLGGKHGDSRQVRCREEFMSQNDGSYGYKPNDEYTPLRDMEYGEEIAMADFVARQAKESPGDPGSPIPGIEAFKDPSTLSQTAAIFRNIKFPYDSSLLKGPENLRIVSAIADFMRRHPNVYIFVEGHCDERGPDAYNLALGARRANSVRNAIVKEGVNPDNIFNISYGKERPSVFGHDEQAWEQNRRAEFKVHQR